MSELKDRLKTARKNAKMTQAQLAKAVPISQGTISDLESGRNKGTASLVKIAQALKVNAHWLATGEGEMNLDGIPISKVELREVEFWSGDTPPDDDEFEVPFLKNNEFVRSLTVNLPITKKRKLKYGRTAAYASGASTDESICTIMPGDSMADRIPNGSMIAIDRSKTDIKDGKIYAFLHNQLFRVKYLHRLPNGGLLIRSHNPQYPDEHINPQEVEEYIKVIGWVWNWSVMERW